MAVNHNPRRAAPHAARARALPAVVLLFLLVVLVAACGKRGGVPTSPPAPGVYHLAGGPTATSLDLRADGTFTIERGACTGIGDLECGRWRTDAVSPAGHVVARDGLYWPTPDDFPSQVMERVTLHGDEQGGLVVVGESPWAGAFTQRWVRGRRCQVCRGGLAAARACDDPLPACVVLGAR